MDIPSAKNKAISASEAENKVADSPTSVRAVSQLVNEYFFPGGGVWKPMNIKAPNREQAEEIHKDTREPVTADEKVAEPTNNE